jgi:excisionase family DNA binding protein
MQIAEREHTRQDTSAASVADAGPKEWLTADHAGVYAGVGVGTIRQACNRNELRHIRVGGGSKGPIRTRKEWIDEWLERWARGGQTM